MIQRIPLEMAQAHKEVMIILLVCILFLVWMNIKGIQDEKEKEIVEKKVGKRKRFKRKMYRLVQTARRERKSDKQQNEKKRECEK